ncbi:MAG: nicotinate (nicotinamide) nucleotide adenylyltransferase [Chloroflexales bacterium]|nr:nicotinate (nicotinamide) nucleotide adenylyltransferase [Chloroflexales bacterium]
MRLGIYGGSFDPIHCGHLAIAEEVRSTLGLASVAFVPAAHQPLKGQARCPPDHRLAMVRLACADNPAFIPDDLELRRPPPSYTINTIETFRARHGPAAELWLIIGADAARDLPRWRRVADILGLARVAIVGRPGHSVDLPALEVALPALEGRCVLIDGPRLDISSTDLRRRLAAGRPVRYQMPDTVRLYIAEHGLYQHD